MYFQGGDRLDKQEDTKNIILELSMEVDFQ
jgi:hypothetical protein